MVMTYNQAVKQVTQKYGLFIAQRYTEVNKILDDVSQQELLRDIFVNIKNMGRQEFADMQIKYLVSHIKKRLDFDKYKYVFDLVLEIHNSDPDQLIDFHLVEDTLKMAASAKDEKDIKGLAEHLDQLLASKLNESVEIIREYEQEYCSSIAKKKHRQKRIDIYTEKVAKITLYRTNLKDMYIARV